MTTAHVCKQYCTACEYLTYDSCFLPCGHVFCQPCAKYFEECPECNEPNHIDSDISFYPKVRRRIPM